jgi:heat shock protein 4
VDYLGENSVFTYTQVSASYLTTIKAITEAELKIPVTDCVISCPGWFTDRQRRAILSAADVAGLNCLKVINDTTAGK